MSFIDENAGHVHGTQVGRDRNWPSRGLRAAMTVMDITSDGWVLVTADRFNILSP